jgi:hypothetical protein
MIFALSAKKFVSFLPVNRKRGVFGVPRNSYPENPLD